MVARSHVLLELREYCQGPQLLDGGLRMNTLRLPRADMDTIVMCLQHLMWKEGWILGSLYSEINAQLDEQEY